MIQANIRQVVSDIEESCRKSGRDPKGVTLVAVTKQVDLETIQQAIDAGVRNIAENRVQEAQAKFPALLAKNPHVRAHIIGHLQTNKAKDAIRAASLIQSVDSVKLAAEIEKQAARESRPVDILVQFNCAREQKKFGVVPSMAGEVIEAVGRYEFLHVKGLMCMAPYTEDTGVIRRTFAELRAIKEASEKRFAGHPRIEFGILSMGMSGDYKIAIEEGSTMVRVGSALFKA